MIKTCVKCNTEKDINQFQKHNNCKDGYRNICKDCRKINIEIDISIVKICNKCGESKSISEFVKNEYCKDGHRGYCKVCDNYDKRKIVNKKKVSDPVKFKEKIKGYIKKDNYIIKRKIRDKERSKTEAYKERKRKLYKINILDPVYKMKLMVKQLTRKAFKQNRFDKSNSTINIIGCSYEEFKIYIEKQFEDWMEWDNHGIYTGNYNETWQIDHIEPISNGITKDEVVRLSHYTNLRPLCSKLNLEKSKSVIL